MYIISIKPTFDEGFEAVDALDMLGITTLEDVGVLMDIHTVDKIGVYTSLCLN